VLGGAVPFQEREMTAGGLYLSHADDLLTFATGKADSVRLEVRWRSGRISVIPGTRSNREYEVAEAAAAMAQPAGTRSPSPQPLFADQSTALNHTHVEIGYDEARRQLLLPNAFAQLGPGVSWYDVDGDGDEDLVIGAGRTGKLAVYLNDKGRLTSVPMDVVAQGDFTTIVAIPNSGGTTLLVGQSSYEAPDLASALALPRVIAVLLDGRGRPAGPVTVAVPGDTGSVGPLTVADYDGDGDLDLFVGGRLMPGAYPYSPSSHLLLNDGQGHFTPDLTNDLLLQHLGMITAAVFADIDGDGDADLLVAVEWGGLKLFLNTGGRFSPAPETWGLNRFHSRWFGLATGDFDGDGRLDLVTTSWGENTRPRVDSLRPLSIYFGDFGGHGSLDLLLAQYDRRIKAIAPVASFARLSRAVPMIAERLKTFSAFADASIETVLGPAAEGALRLGVDNSSQLLWLNRGDHFQPTPLPREAQLAPAIAPVVGDFDGDGFLDLVLSQNFFPTDLNTPRYDAGRSLLLKGDGKGGFTPVPGPESGLMVYGDQRGAAAADFDQDGRLDVVVSQNGAATRLFRNQGAAPGLRVVLEGLPNNPHSVGAQLRLESAGGQLGPVQEVQAVNGYWSMNGATQVLTPLSGATAVQVRWPTGQTTRIQIPPRTTTISIAQPR
jgi:hypothetical protein